MPGANDPTAPCPAIGELLLHPVAVTSVLLLLLNDHWLKSRFPGAITGKLSDFAGLVFFPLLLLTLFDAVYRLFKGRPGLTPRALVVCIVMTGLAFIAVKTTDLGAGLFRYLWAVMQWPARVALARRWVPLGRVHLVQDTTDLIAVPMLLVAYYSARRSALQP